MNATQDATTQKFAVELRKIDDIRPYERNPRINDQAVDAVAASLAEFGFRQPIVVDADGVIIVGHTRWKAAKKLGLARVPVHVATDLTAEQARAYRIADNKTGELAEWDLEILPIELNELREGGLDLDVLAFDEEELGKLLTSAQGVTEGLTDPDWIPEPPDEPVTQRGDIWLLGDHRLMCGDSGSPEDLDRLLDGAVIDLVNMDPPYNVKVEPRSSTAIAAGLSSFQNKKAQLHHQGFDQARGVTDPKKARKKMRAKDRPLENDFVSDEAFDQMLLAWFSNAARVLKPGGSFYIWGGYANLGNYPAPLKKAGLYFSQGIVWDKQHPVLTRKDMMGCFELAFYGWKEGAGHHFYGPNNATDLWHVKKVNPQAMVHLTEKPVELATRSIQYSSKPGESVLDLFGGSGSTLIACEQTGRRAFLMELDRAYCDVIVQRWEKFTGNKARRIAAAKPEVEAEAEVIA
ncbi:MAG TPA: DNA modification methylase [Phycisphaerae bacterium]|jgi:DNA modification methylase|nr:DNA modification methylase [Accumulibacter sp.]HOL26934.1 DNA modification methylase [Phycisphaerae bacterium]HPP29133.1 DNA modification methylase [Phycisphaerae bacterium]HPU81350.1 DNA modification methylase [Accumulibacter sp.]